MLPPEIARREVEIALGRNREDKNFRTLKGVLGQLFETGAPLAGFTEGEKDGLCILQGALVGGQRLAKNSTRNYTMMFDHDTGESVNEIKGKIEEAGLFAVLWTTYSHMQAETTIAEDALLKWVKKSGRAPGKDGTITAAQAADFLKETKKVKPEIFDVPLTLTRQHVEGGMKYKLTHAPMPRVRSMFVLDKPFDFAQRGGSQMAAIQEWKERYAGLANMLGLTWDRSCIDPSRLMYTPRVPPGTKLAELGHVILPIPGKLLDIDKVPRHAEERTGKPRDTDDLKAALGGEGEAPREPFKTPGLLAFLRDHARDFEAATMLRSLFPEDVRHDYGDKIEFRCPWEDYHTEQKAGDRGFAVWDASMREGGFDARCQHNTCKEASKGDRAWFLDRLCEHYDLDVETLKEYCPSEEARAEEKKEETDALTAAIEKLTPKSTRDEINAVLKELAKIEDVMTLDDMITLIVEKTKRTKGVIKEAIETFRKAGYGGGGDGDNNTPPPQRHPPPDDPADATVIWDSWTHAQKNNCACARFMDQNNKNPVVYQKKTDNSTIRIVNGSGRVTLENMDREKWAYELEHHMVFKKVTRQGDELILGAFDKVTQHMNSGRDRGFPVLDRIINVPVFSPDGTLRTEKGYDKGLQHFINIDPDLKIPDVPDVVSEADVAEATYWFLEAILDFPFSDTFDGSDMLPQYTDKLDDEMWHRPNLERGRSSRTNFMALMIQPIVRGMIDGPCPCYHIDKSAPGTGAGYLANVSHIMMEGTTAEPQPMSDQNEEVRKSITASLLGGSPMIFLDNINHKVASGHLAAALTAGVWKDRILGESRIVAVPNTATWIIAGNNLQFSHELMRRNVPIRIDANVPNPTQDRCAQDFKYDLTPWLKDHRTKLLWSAYVLGRNWIQKGKPSGKKRIHSFDAWSNVMGGIFEAANIPGFLENIPNYLGNRDEDAGSFEEFARHLYETFKENPMTIGKMYELSLNPMTNRFNFELPLAGNTDHAQITALGKLVHAMMSGHTFRLTDDGLTGKLIKTRERNPAMYRWVLKLG
jgi:hypothetical protein